MEQRVAIDRHIALPKALHAGVGPGRKDLCAVAVTRQLGRPGGAAGVKVSRDVLRVKHPLADQALCRMQGALHMKVVHACGPCLRIGQRPAIGRHQQHGAQAVTLRLQPQRFGAQLRIVVHAVGDQHLGTTGLQQGQELVVAQQRVEWLHNARRFAAPQRQMVGQATRQQHRHRIGFAHAQAVQQVGRLVNALQQFLIRPCAGRPAHEPGF